MRLYRGTKQRCSDESFQALGLCGSVVHHRFLDARVYHAKHKHGDEIAHALDELHIFSPSHVAPSCQPEPQQLHDLQRPRSCQHDAWESSFACHAYDEVGDSAVRQTKSCPRRPSNCCTDTADPQNSSSRPSGSSKSMPITPSCMLHVHSSGDVSVKYVLAGVVYAVGLVPDQQLAEQHQSR